MTFLIKHFAPFTSMKRAIIEAALAGMSDTAKELMLKQIIASQLPKMCLGHRPYQKNGKKPIVDRGWLTFTMNTDGKMDEHSLTFEEEKETPLPPSKQESGDCFKG